ncbi:MAG: DUF763 domain-containing protein [Chloroflexi bacterium]|nr:DUF763 domain-containing protein [Chloroflexota bacterium]
MRTGIANLPLHYGKAPRWLFQRMAQLAREISILIVEEFGTDELLRRLSDPFWFQAFGCVLGFDWHSSGVTTTVCGALKEGLRGMEGELGLFVAGGKGRVSRKTPAEIGQAGEKAGFDPAPLIYASRMAAKVDNTALQDGYQLYHHVFIFTASGAWAVVQQGMNGNDRTARRYHWLGEGVEEFVNEPHAAICCDQRQEGLNMVAAESSDAREVVATVACQQPEHVIAELEHLKQLTLPHRHAIELEDLDPKRLSTVLLRSYEQQPANFEAFLGIVGVGPKTLRAISLISELAYGVAPSFRDPVRYSFAHGGKDGYPYPVDRATYDRSIELLREALRRAKVGDRERVAAIRRLSRFAAA